MKIGVVNIMAKSDLKTQAEKMEELKQVLKETVRITHDISLEIKEILICLPDTSDRLTSILYKQIKDLRKRNEMLENLFDFFYMAFKMQQMIDEIDKKEE